MDGLTRFLVMQHGWNTTCYQITNPGFELWFPVDLDAVVGYVRRGKVRVVAGAPVCAPERLASVVDEWESAGGKSCYFAAEEQLRRELAHRSGYSAVVLGSQPVWHPRTWARAVDGSASLRAQLSRARNKGVEVSEWPAERAKGNAQLRDCLKEWLETRGLPPLHFLIEPETLDDLGDRRLFVATISGEAVAFVVMSPIPTRNGWLTEQFVRGRSAPNGTIELALDFAIRAVGRDGAELITMGIVPLADRAGAGYGQNPPWLRFVTGWIRAHGRRFYNFAGLENFKSKFRPDYWEPIYVISHEPRFSMRSLYAISAAFTRSNPFLVFAKGVLLAIRQELLWLFKLERK